MTPHRVIVKLYRKGWWQLILKGQIGLGLRALFGIGWHAWAGKPSLFIFDNFGFHFDVDEIIDDG